MTARVARPVSVARPIAADRPLPAAVADLTQSRGVFARLAPTLAAELDAAVARMRAGGVTVTFGGRFKTGKSSVLDAALGERLLPTGDLPETGVSCHVRHGIRRTAALIGTDGKREVACVTGELRKAVTLRGRNERVSDLAGVERVDIELPDFPGGPHAVWIDPPGLFDVDEMTERARRAMDAADVVVWVLRSQQFLGEAEMEEIAGRLDRRGWASVVLVENAYLRTGHPDPWAEHLEEVVPVNREKLRRFAAEMGFPALPPVVSVSAEEVLTRGPSAPGAKDLQHLLAGLSRADTPRVTAARWQWLHRVLTELGEAVAPVYERVKGANDTAEEADAEADETHTQRESELAAEVTAAVDQFVSGFGSAVTGSGAVIAAGVSAADYKTDATYDTQLKARMLADFAVTSAALFARLDDRLRRWRLPTLPAAARGQLLAKITPTYCSVAVATTVGTDKGTLGGAAAGAAAGAVIGSFIPILGNIAGACIGGVAGAIAGNKKNTEINRTKDVAATKADIGVTASATAGSVINRRAEILTAVTAAYLAQLPTAAETLVDRREEEELELALVRLRRAVAECNDALEVATGWMLTESV